MHLPDGSLCVPVCAAAAGVSAAAVGYSLRKLVFARPSPSELATMAVVGAGVGALQSLNFPVSSGVSGHLLGGAAAVALLGPWSAVVVMASVLAVQAVLFGDGGTGALGANILNMAVLPAALGGALQALSRKAAIPSYSAAGFAIWFVAGTTSILLAAAACAWELTIDRPLSLAAILPAMISAHGLAAVAEGFVTAAIGVWGRQAWDSVTGSRRRLFAAAACGLLLAAFSPFASQLPDGLATVTAQCGLDRAAQR